MKARATQLWCTSTQMQVVQSDTIPLEKQRCRREGAGGVRHIWGASKEHRKIQVRGSPDLLHSLDSSRIMRMCRDSRGVSYRGQGFSTEDIRKSSGEEKKPERALMMAEIDAGGTSELWRASQRQQSQPNLSSLAQRRLEQLHHDERKKWIFNGRWPCDNQSKKVYQENKEKTGRIAMFRNDEEEQDRFCSRLVVTSWNGQMSCVIDWGAVLAQWGSKEAHSLDEVSKARCSMVLSMNSVLEEIKIMRVSTEFKTGGLIVSRDLTHYSSERRVSEKLVVDGEEPIIDPSQKQAQRKIAKVGPSRNWEQS
ncbi:hypothetical protein Tco_0096771 [Tanacetum coccineum]|uniref:Uncharacterized protein n=1 Tax=Tanacetum coccineum TaxID=301880 RepID=A0ABQ5AU49_9ASTR